MRDRFMVSMQAIDDAAVSNADLGAWLRLHRYCAARFNGGRIRSCRSWGKDDWLRHVGLTKRDVDSVEQVGMALWEGDDLLIKWYDLPGEKLYPAQSAGGKLGADRRWAAHRSAKGSGNGEPNGSPIDPPNSSPDAQGGGKASQIHSRSDVSSEHPARATAPSTAFSRDGHAPTWAARHRDMAGPMLAQFGEPGARIIDVLRFFRVMFEVRGESLEGEWQRETSGQTPLEVALVFVHAPEGSIRLPGAHYRPARRAFQSAEMQS